MIFLLKEHQEISPGMLLTKGSFLSDLDLSFLMRKNHQLILLSNVFYGYIMRI